jgi:hypothetical protein
MGIVPEQQASPDLGGLSRKRLGTPKLTSDSPSLSQKRFETPKLTASDSVDSIDSQKSDSSLDADQVRKDSKYQFKDSELELIKILGQGTGGLVSLVLHKPTGIQMAKKVLIRLN